MLIRETDLPGVLLIEPKVFGDERGYFLETWSAERYEADHYHQQSDELTPEWNFDGMVQDARFGFLAGFIVANDDALPEWNAGNEFEAARRAALDAAGPP